MALRIFQFGIVFAIGFYLGPASSFEGDVGVIEIPLSIQLKDPRDVTVSKGQSATLQCEIQSFPLNPQDIHHDDNDDDDVRIFWFYNGEEIYTNDTKRRILQVDGNADDDGRSRRRSSSLFIPKVVGGKRNNGVQGEYQCMASSRLGSVLSNPAKLRIGSFDHITAHPSNVTVHESQPAVLFCNIHSIPAAQIQWEFNAKELPRDTRYVPLPTTGALLITKTHSSHAGFYRCKATNILLNKINHSKPIQLEILPQLINDNAPPTFLPLYNTTTLTVLLGENTTLICAVTASPLPTVQWLNSNDVIIGNSSILHLSNVTLNDAGNYTCTAYNKLGRIFQKHQLQIHQKPYFNITPTSKKFPSAITVRLDCQALGVPEPKIHWLKNGQPLAISGRIKKQPTGLVFSHTFTYDSGIYQCIAVNSAGRVWAAAQLVLQSTSTPSPPEDVQCRPFDENRICLTWKSPEKNVYVQAYTVNTLIAVEPEVLGPEYVTNYTFFLADKLNSSTNYTFYIRLYSNAASDNSKRVTCETGVKGSRNLEITSNSEDDSPVQLKWSKISTDVPCNGESSSYRLMWRMKNRSQIYSATKNEFSHVIFGLAPNAEYEFRVLSNNNYLNENANVPWQSFTTPGSSSTNTNHNEDDEEEILVENSDDPLSPPTPPEHLEANTISATSVNLSWTDSNTNTQYFTICCVNLARNGSVCSESKSSSNVSQVSGLEPDTLYKFRVKTHSSNGMSSVFSEDVEFHTPADVPFRVLDLKYKVLNESAACLVWQAPIHKHAIINYEILYSPDQNWDLGRWYRKTIIASQKKSKSCSPGSDDKSFSTLLDDLNPHKHYTVLVRAVSRIGQGQLTHPVLVNTQITEKSFTETATESKNLNNNNDQTYGDFLGIILGVVIALVCIIVCVACILVRKRCIKSRRREEQHGGGRMTSNSNDYYPAAHYTSEGNSVHVRFSHPCNVEIHEIEHLVAEDTSPGIPQAIPAHLDTKGNDGFPNGHLNGSAKSYTNGHVINGDVRITENPRYGVYREKKDEETIPCIDYDEEEDSNSNLKGSKFKDLHRIFEKAAKETSESAVVPPMQTQKTDRYNNECNSHLIGKLSNDDDHSTKKNNISFNFNNKSTNSSCSSSDDDDDDDDGGLLNATQVTCLDNSFITTTINNHHRRVSPIVGPNG